MNSYHEELQSQHVSVGVVDGMLEVVNRGSVSQSSSQLSTCVPLAALAAQWTGRNFCPFSVDFFFLKNYISLSFCK